MIRVILEQSIHAVKISVDFDVYFLIYPFFNTGYNGPQVDARKPDCCMQTAKVQTSLSISRV